MNKCITLEKDGNVIRDQSKIADCFLDYFSSVAKGIRDIKLLELNEEQVKSHACVQRINEYKKVVSERSPVSI